MNLKAVYLYVFRRMQRFCSWTMGHWIRHTQGEEAYKQRLIDQIGESVSSTEIVDDAVFTITLMRAYKAMDLDIMDSQLVRDFTHYVQGKTTNVEFRELYTEPMIREIIATGQPNEQRIIWAIASKYLDACGDVSAHTLRFRQAESDAVFNANEGED